MHQDDSSTQTVQQTGKSRPDREPIVFRKGEQRWVFVCDAEGEPELLAHIGRLAAQRVGGFDWFDAALVGHQIRQRLNASLRRQDNTAPSQRPTDSGRDAA